MRFIEVCRGPRVVSGDFRGILRRLNVYQVSERTFVPLPCPKKFHLVPVAYQKCSQGHSREAKRVLGAFLGCSMESQGVL